MYSAVGIKRTHCIRDVVFERICVSSRESHSFSSLAGRSTRRTKRKKDKMTGLENMDHMDERKLEKPNIKGDKVNIIVLILMYTLQSALSGLNTEALPIILQRRKITYADQVRSTRILLCAAVVRASPFVYIRFSSYS